jgi:hypothetical protein
MGKGYFLATSPSLAPADGTGVICGSQLHNVTTLYIKIPKGYTPEGTGNKKKDIDSNHTIKRNLLLRIKVITTITLT